MLAWNAVLQRREHTRLHHKLESIRFLADENFRFSIIRGLRRRQPHIDILTAEEAAIRGMSDADVLTVAAAHGRILLSHDVHTLPTQFAVFLASGQHSPGVFLFAQDGAIGATIDCLQLVWLASEPTEWIDRLEYLP